MKTPVAFKTITRAHEYSSPTNVVHHEEQWAGCVQIHGLQARSDGMYALSSPAIVLYHKGKKPGAYEILLFCSYGDDGILAYKNAPPGRLVTFLIMKSSCFFGGGRELSSYPLDPYRIHIDI